MTRINRDELGRQPQSNVMRMALRDLLTVMDFCRPGEEAIVHHYSDTTCRFQAEVEFRKKDGQVRFQRVVITSEQFYEYVSGNKARD